MGSDDALRLYLTGGLAVEGPAGVVDDARLAGRQGRLALAHLTLERRRPVPTAELAEVLWPGGAPRAWDTAVRALMSKLRSAFTAAGADGSSVLDARAGCYRLRLPTGSWVDVEAAGESLEEAESALRAGDPSRAWAAAMVTSSIVRRPLLAGEDAPWISEARQRLGDVLVRALDCLTEASLACGDPALAIRLAEDAVALQPFREAGYRQLMRAQVAAGHRAEAVRVYERCRTLLADDLGVDPAPDTERVYLAVLRGAPLTGPPPHAQSR